MPDRQSAATVVYYPTSYGKFAVDSLADSKMARSFEQGVHPNEPLLRFAKACTDETSIVLDVGAHIGTFTVPISMHVRKVIAFEPAEKTLDLLRENVATNAASVDIRTCALGRTEGRAGIVERKDENAGANTLGEGNAIKVSTLDNEVDRADFIKIDV